ncbi:TetR/AcrR family transcriptional regulator [Nocardia yamanashiensis]|uniref:TetR/AcrR family transcriptional regulator n=1 Tax=Nocardia yamanashiensis TaxID=209247 RepID=UPI001E56E1FB|nr:TetR/AcrR family transcriptional regulator [Nocardia yamanashiensis]UGT44668.1 TetR/AcrR family transcriptional regulator [Nocardia yamanashiensis]
MSRLSRTESHAQTRAQLLITARRLFFEDGYHPTSLEKVAEAAGYSKGAVYSNFRNKDELCVAVLDDVRAERLGEAIAALGAGDGPARTARFREWAETIVGDPGWTTLEAEFAVHARRDPTQRAELAARLDTLLNTIAAAASELGGPESPLPARETATALLALGVGLGVFRAIDPSIPADSLIGLVALLGDRKTP